MESTQILNKPTLLNEKVQPYQLNSIWDHSLDQIKVLSLDCFDTIIWRRTAVPIDVFYELQNKPSFKNLEFSALLRMQYEAQARQLKLIKEINTEVKLSDIYLAAFPNLKKSQIAELENEELKTEIEHCYALPAMVDFMRTAIEKKIKIIIVSDTYFTEKQLRELLSSCLPTDVMQAISNIFCSCEYDKSKSNGLFRVILQKLSISPQSILHLGDNHLADVESPQLLNIRAIEFLHYGQHIKEKFRLQASAANIFNSSIRNSKPHLNIFRGIISSHDVSTHEQIIGFTTIGPLMYAFAKFISHEVNELAKNHKNLKVLFLMRDGHLPALACEALLQKSIGKRVNISRFTAYAASFRSKDDIDKYLTNTLFTGRYEDIARQLLLPDEIIKPLVDVTLASDSPITKFLELIHSDDILDIIIKKSQMAKNRLLTYLKKEVDLQKGDNLVFIDLGYSGTAQRLLEPIFLEELEIKTYGRYLIELNIPEWKSSRRGLLDPSWCDDRALHALVAHIALLEQICTSNDKSVIDYDNYGNPIYSKTNLQKSQYFKLEKIQQECLRFIRTADEFFNKTTAPSLDDLQEASMAELARFIFLPTAAEVEYLESFQFDLNLGTNDVIRVFDSNEGLNSLRKRGLFFSFMEKNSKSMRTNYPAELRYAGLELVMTVMAQYRFGLDIGYNDVSLRHEKINVIVEKNHEKITSLIEAKLTYDGFYSVMLPIGNRDFTMIINFGKNYQWLEIDSAELINSNLLLSKADSLYAEDISSNLIYEDIVNKGGKLYECLSDSSAVIIPSLPEKNDNNYVVRMVFRPIVSKTHNS